MNSAALFIWGVCLSMAVQGEGHRQAPSKVINKGNHVINGGYHTINGGRFTVYGGKFKVHGGDFVVEKSDYQHGDEVDPLVNRGSSSSSSSDSKSSIMDDTSGSHKQHHHHYHHHHYYHRNAGRKSSQSASHASEESERGSPGAGSNSASQSREEGYSQQCWFKDHEPSPVYEFTACELEQLQHLKPEMVKERRLNQEEVWRFVGLLYSEFYPYYSEYTLNALLDGQSTTSDVAGCWEALTSSLHLNAWYGRKSLSAQVEYMKQFEQLERQLTVFGQNVQRLAVHVRLALEGRERVEENARLYEMYMMWLCVEEGLSGVLGKMDSLIEETANPNNGAGEENIIAVRLMFLRKQMGEVKNEFIKNIRVWLLFYRAVFYLH